MKTFYELQNEGAFKNQVKYPYTDEFKSYYLYKEGMVYGLFTKDEARQFLGTPIEKFSSIEVESKRLGFTYEEIVSKKEYEIAREAYNIECDRINDLFKDCLAYEFDVEDNPKLGTLLGISWDRGHAGGLNDVYCVFSELVELIK